MPSRTRTVGLVATLLGGAMVFAWVVDRHYAVRSWLIWRYLGYWLAVSFWAAACASLGYWIVGRLLPKGSEKVERFTLGFAVGVLAFALSIFFIGLLHGLHAWLFFL